MNEAGGKHYGTGVTPWDLCAGMQTSGVAHVDALRCDVIEYFFRMKGNRWKQLDDLKKGLTCAQRAVEKLEEDLKREDAELEPGRRAAMQKMSDMFRPSNRETQAEERGVGEGEMPEVEDPTAGLPPLPEGFVYLGQGLKFNRIPNKVFHGAVCDPYSWNDWAIKDYEGNDPGLHYSAPADSEVARLNGKGREVDLKNTEGSAIFCKQCGALSGHYIDCKFYKP